MFFLRRHCHGFIAPRLKIRLASFQEKIVVSESKSDDKDEKQFCEKSSRIGDEASRNNYCCNEKLRDIKVGIIGGGMAPIYASVLLKQSRFIKRINIADPNDEIAGAVYDSGHIDTSTRIKYYGKSCMNEALIDVDIVALMDEKYYEIGKSGLVGQFLETSSYARRMAELMVECCPSAFVAVFARPVTATLPMISEIYKFSGWLDPNRIVGSIAIEAMRIESMTACLFDLNPSYLTVPIVGGADSCTVVPLLTRAKPISQISPEHESTLIHQLRTADENFSSCSSRYGGPTLSNGAAAAKFIDSIAAGLVGRPNVIRSAYVRSNVLPICRYFASELLFGRRGIEKNYGLPKASSQAIDLIEQSVPRINELTEIAINIVRNDNTIKSSVR